MPYLGRTPSAVPVDASDIPDNSITAAKIVDGAIAVADIADDAVTEAKLANAINTAISDNTAKVTNATHTGDVTGATALTIADNAVTLAKMAGGTDGELITYDTLGDPAKVAVGTSGHVLTSGGAGVAPTFQAAAAGGVDGIVSSADATAITIDSNENVGVKTSSTLKTWYSQYSAIQLGHVGAWYCGKDGTGFGNTISENVWSDGSPKYLNSSYQACEYSMVDGAHKFKVAPSGTADAAITWTTALEIKNDGRGLSQFTAKAWINFNGTSTAAIRDSHNISSLTDNGTGDYTVAYTNAVGAGNSVALSTAYVDNSGKGSMAWFGNAAVGTTSYRFYTRHHDNTSMDSDTVTGITFGD